jgi:cytochrome c-type biogenesis protein CcmH
VRRYLGWLAIVWLLALCAVVLLAYGGSTKAESLDQRTLLVASGLQCLVCQGESVAESPSGFARSVRVLIRTQLRAGKTPDQIRSFLVSRYTNAILLEPPASGLGDLAWLAPPLLVLGGLGLLATLVYDWRGKGGGAPAPASRAEYVERVRQELAAESET